MTCNVTEFILQMHLQGCFFSISEKTHFPASIFPTKSFHFANDLTTHFFSQALKLICGKTSQRFKLFQKTTSLQSNGRQARGYPIKFEQSNTLNVPHWHNVGSNRSVEEKGKLIQISQIHLNLSRCFQVFEESVRAVLRPQPVTGGRGRCKIF